LELHTTTDDCSDRPPSSNFYEVANFSVMLDRCEDKTFALQRVSCHGPNTLKVELFEKIDTFCSNSSKTWIIERNHCYDAQTGERIQPTSSPTVTPAPTRSPVWNLLNYTANCSDAAITEGMYKYVDQTNSQWMADCFFFADAVTRAEENGTQFNDTHITCSCFGPLSFDQAWDILNCKITPQFNGVNVWVTCNNLGYGLEDRRRNIYQSDYSPLEDIEWEYTHRRPLQGLSVIDVAFAAFANVDWDLKQRRLMEIGDDDWIGLNWDIDPCSDTCVCQDEYTNEFGYGYTDPNGNCECGMIQVLGMSCDADIRTYPNVEMGINPWSRGEKSVVIDRCMRNLDSPRDGQYRKVSCINNGTNLLYQLYNDDPTCTDESASIIIEDMKCYNYSRLGQYITHSPTANPTNVPTVWTSKWPVLNHSLCRNQFEVALGAYIVNNDLDIAEDCIVLLNAEDKTEETVACPCLSQIPEWFALEQMNCNISESYQGLEVWAHCICIGYPNCIYTGDCLEECPYYPLCPGPGGLSDCPDRRRKPIERRRADVDSFKVIGIGMGLITHCGNISPYPTLSPTTTKPTIAPTKAPSLSPSTPFPTLSPTTPFPTLSPTTPFPTHIPTRSPTFNPSTSPTTGWPSLHPTPAEDDASAFGIIFLEMDKRDELLMLAIMAMTLFCIIFCAWKLIFEPRLGLYDNLEEEGEEFIISDDHEHFRMSSTKVKKETSVKFVDRD